jgi:predicted metalloprotease
MSCSLAPFRRVGVIASVTFVMVFVCGTMLSPISAQEPASPTPQTYRGSGSQSYQGSFADLASAIDAYWTDVFRDAQRQYQSPDIVNVIEAMSTGCGDITPEPNAFYCPPDRTIYLVPQFLQDQERQFGDYAPIAVLSHEWGHHIQNLLGIKGPTSKAFELQADCLMGAFTRHADEAGLLDYGDFLEALSTAIDAGDPTFLPEDAPGAHGQPEDRVKALTKGYGGGPVTGCGLPLNKPVPPSIAGSIRDTLFTPTQTVSNYLPVTLPLQHAPCFRVEAEGTLTFEELVDRLGGTEEARQRLRDWGWQESAYRNFACDTPPPGSAGWVEVSLHLFGDGASAQAAVDYFSALRAEGTRLIFGPAPRIGDRAAVLAGPATNGHEFTLYASEGPLLIRVTTIAPTGIPFADTVAIAQEVLSRFAAPGSVLPGFHSSNPD